MVRQIEIRGPTDESTQMILGQIRKVFDPDWIQGFGNGGFTVQFCDEPDSENELLNFIEMYDFSLKEKETATWCRYYFE